MDRISQLPESLQHQIIILLQEQDKTLKSPIYFSLLSKSCYHAWLTYPYLAFTCMGHSNNYNDFVARVDRTLQRFRSNGLSLHGFSVTGCLKKPQDDLNQWMKYVTGFNVSVIDFHFCNSSDIVVPFSMLSHVGSLRELRLRSCFLDDTGVVTLGSLRKLRLNYIRNRGKMIEDVIHGCPLLEHLEILSCFEVKSLCISGVSKLQSVLLDDDVGRFCLPKSKEVSIDAPCIREFVCNWRLSHIPFLSDVASWSCLRKLCLTGQDAIGPLNEEALEELLIQLCHLEYLSLSNCNWIIWNGSPKISSLSIQVLHLVHCKYRGALFIDCPRLCLFYYQDADVPRIDKDSTFSLDCKFDLYLSKSGYNYQDKLSLLAELKMFFWNTKIKLACLKVELPPQSWFTEGLGFHKEKVAHMPQPAKLNYLELRLRQCQEFPFVLLDLLLWICHPDFIVFTFNEMDNDAQKVLLRSTRDIVTKTRPTTFECGCSNGQEAHHQCWHQSLRDVKLDWLGTTQGKDKEVDFQSMELDVLSQQVLRGPTNLRVRLGLTWN